MATIRHKRGDTFDQLLAIPAEFEDGYFIGWTVTSQIRKPGGRLIADLTATWAVPEEETRLLRLFNAETSAWPIGDQAIDVQFVRDSDGFTRSTETLTATILRDVTQ